MTDAPLDAEEVIRRLEEAGRTLMCLPDRGPTTKLRTGGLDYVSEWTAYAASDEPTRPARPRAAEVTRMETTFEWLRLVPDDRRVIRRIVAARALIHPTNDRHMFSWRRLGRAIGADHRAVKRWHSHGIDMIVLALQVRDASGVSSKVRLIPRGVERARLPLRI